MPAGLAIRIGAAVAAVALVHGADPAASGDGRPSLFDWLQAGAVIEATSPAASSQTTVEKNVPADGPASEPLDLQGISKVSAVEVLGDRKETLFQLVLSRGVTAEVYTLAKPYRVIIDLPGVVFDLPPDAGRDARGLVSAYRYGQFDEGKARIVLDTRGPVAIAKAGMVNARSGAGVILTVALQPTGAAAFGGGTGAGRQTSGSARLQPDTPVAPKSATSKPVIVIDPGHGGIDPGAVGAADLLEKDLVLSVAKRLRALLDQSGRYEVVMTRSRDVFVSLNDRLAKSRKVQSDLFISLHADSIEQTYAQSIKGATIYTLSERASDAEARAIAEKENASDLIAGLDVAMGEENDDVKNILIDLLKRETANFSAEFSKTLVRSLKSNVSLSRDPQRSAAFKVLRQTHAPSVLVELGYVSNPDESRQMQSAAWQEKVAASIAAAVATYFSKRPSASR